MWAVGLEVAVLDVTGEDPEEHANEEGDQVAHGYVLFYKGTLRTLVFVVKLCEVCAEEAVHGEEADK